MEHPSHRRPFSSTSRSLKALRRAPQPLRNSTCCSNRPTSIELPSRATARMQPTVHSSCSKRPSSWLATLAEDSKPKAPPGWNRNFPTAVKSKNEWPFITSKIRAEISGVSESTATTLFVIYTNPHVRTHSEWLLSE